MTYHKRIAKKRKCAHCGTKFLSNHQRRIYCSQSCNTQAWRARWAQAGEASAQPAGPVPAGLAFSARNVGVLALSSALGTLAAQLSKDLTQRLLHGGTDWELLQAELRAGLAQLGAAPGAESPAGPVGEAPAPAASPVPRATAPSPAQRAAVEPGFAAPQFSPEQLAAKEAAFVRVLEQPWPDPPAP